MKSEGRVNLALPTVGLGNVFARGRWSGAALAWNGGMQALRVMMLMVALAFGYVLFFSTQSKQADVSIDPSKPAAVVSKDPAVQDQYKQAMNRAQAAAKAMQAERREADAD